MILLVNLTLTSTQKDMFYMQIRQIYFNENDNYPHSSKTSFQLSELKSFFGTA